VDGVGAGDSLGSPVPAGLCIRAAQPADAALLAEIDVEHCGHYFAPPALMVSAEPRSAQGFREFLSTPGSTAWLALEGGQAAAFMQFEGSGHGASDIVADSATVALTGAYTRPAWRGRGLAPALLDAALAHYRSQGMARCSVDFESLNPTAAAFWVKYFQVVCLSVIRVPEREA
jgi:GNAT superfamily N-acetyltransferase